MRIVGISAFYHDSAAALIEDGQIIAVKYLKNSRPCLVSIS